MIRFLADFTSSYSAHCDSDGCTQALIRSLYIMVITTVNAMSRHIVAHVACDSAAKERKNNRRIIGS